ncbi:MAG: nucleotidyl transferase AbiEii/AbiGii toxin family protein [Flavobacteriales bacterium]|nr:nucleotidyl transferase AbiEii/AbiGii toxin family protein [Flavobacteriales bacterium]
MLSLQEIKTYYPENLQVFERFIVREYLQYKILEILFESDYANKLAFLGGTCLRIVHGSTRFSEDLDFDNFDLKSEDFNGVTIVVKRELERLGYEVEMRNVEKGAYHCYIRFPEILFREGLSNHKEEKILIQLDTEAHDFEYESDLTFLNKFDVFTQIHATPIELLLAQKFYAVINRKRNKGRDFFDINFLLGKGIIPNYEYLNVKVGINNAEDLRTKIIQKCNDLDMKEMAADVKPFLFDPKDEKKVLLFTKYMEQVKLG